MERTGDNTGDYYGEIRAKNDKSADLYFYGDIVSSWWGAWDKEDQWPEKVRAFLDETKGVANLNIYINSGGGSCFAGMAIYNMLARHKAYKTVYVDGLAASMASIIALCGDKVVIPANAWMMIHQPWGYIVGNADEMEKEVAALRAIEEGMLNTYCARALPCASRDTLFAMMRAETWLTGEQAAQYFNIETTPVSTAAACMDSEHYAKYRNMPQGLNIGVKPLVSESPVAAATDEPDVKEVGAVAAAKTKLGLSLSISRRIA